MHALDSTALDNAFDLDPRTDMTALAACGDSADDTSNGCGESPTAGPTSGCAAPENARHFGVNCAR